MLTVRTTPTGALQSTPGTNSQDLVYLHTDHLGSTALTTQANGSVQERLAYDPWGDRRHATTTGTAPNQTLAGSADAVNALQPGTTAGTPSTNRGYTGHEHLDRGNLGLIHANARIYDPTLGLFLSPDPFIQAPHYTQSHNRYSYTFNNPLKYTDPSGYTAVYAELPSNMNNGGLGGFGGLNPLNGFAGFGQILYNEIDGWKEEEKPKPGEKPKCDAKCEEERKKLERACNRGQVQCAFINPEAYPNYFKYQASANAWQLAARQAAIPHIPDMSVTKAANATQTPTISGDAGTAAGEGYWGRLLGRLLGGLHVLPLLLTGDTPSQSEVYHYTTQAGYVGITTSGVINPSRDGNVYVTPAYYSTPAEAQAKLALSQAPVGYFVIPKADILPASPPSPVAPANGQPGGGVEIKAPHPVPVKSPIFVRFPS